MENDSTYYTDLITRYFSAEANESEMQMLADWIKLSPENQKNFEEYQQIWLNIEKERTEKLIDIDDEWNKISKKTIHAQNEPKVIQLKPESKPNTFLRILKYAAIFILFAVSATFLYYYFTKPQTKQLLAQTETVESKLPDGTSVTLNKGSVLEYPSKFEKNKRSVKLKGEAYFNVTHDDTKPFIIAADDIVVEVLGTSFYVNTDNPEGKVEVILTTGKVAVYYKDKPDDKIIMEPGDKVELTKNQESISKTVNEDENYLSWKTKKLIFEDESLKDIVNTLNKVYRSKIQIKDKNIANCKITATFENQSLDAVLNVIEATVDVDINKTADVIQISGKGCN
jgi:transmembrane sensor